MGVSVGLGVGVAVGDGVAVGISTVGVGVDILVGNKANAGAPQPHKSARIGIKSVIRVMLSSCRNYTPCPSDIPPCEGSAVPENAFEL
jgi:hypothetical protein